jgi:hypothetical protein
MPQWLGDAAYDTRLSAFGSDDDAFSSCLALLANQAEPQMQQNHEA